MDHPYRLISLFVAGIVTVIIGFFSLRCNSLLISVYSSSQHRQNSTALFLCALGCSDFCLTFTIMFLGGLVNWRHEGIFQPLLNVYGLGYPLVVQLCLVLGTTSIYFCIAAAVNCLRSAPCTPKRAKEVVIVITCLSFVLMIPQFMSVDILRCLSDYSLAPSFTPCLNLHLRSSFKFIVYQAYILIPLRVILPLLLLIILGFCLIVTQLRKRHRGRQPVPTTDDNFEQFEIETISSVNSAQDYTTSVIAIVVVFMIWFSIELFVHFALYQVLDYSYQDDILQFVKVCHCAFNLYIYCRIP
uniref:G_PROTEIN_RECEP_F1_2 domain-containing protein n=1 Tax=Panagrellus redivivus TaxID=6233 RepID=A0A7E4ZTE6_PANRE